MVGICGDYAGNGANATQKRFSIVDFRVLDHIRNDVNHAGWNGFRVAFHTISGVIRMQSQCLL